MFRHLHTMIQTMSFEIEFSENDIVKVAFSFPKNHGICGTKTILQKIGLFGF